MNDWSDFYFDMHAIIHIDMKNKDKIIGVLEELRKIDALNNLNFENLKGAVECLNEVQRVS